MDHPVICSQKVSSSSMIPSSLADMTVDGKGKLMIAAAKEKDDPMRVYEAISAEFFAERSSLLVPRPATNEIYVFDPETGRHVETR